MVALALTFLSDHPLAALLRVTVAWCHTQVPMNIASLSPSCSCHHPWLPPCSRPVVVPGVSGRSSHPVQLNRLVIEKISQ